MMKKLDAYLPSARALTGVAALAVLAASAAALPGGPIEGCTPVAGGGFDEGLAGWTVTPTQESTGDAFTFVAAEPVNGRDFGDAFSGPAAALSVFATAGGGGGSGAALAAVVLSRQVRVTASMLQLTKGGGFEFLFFGPPELAIESELRVEGTRGAASMSLGDSSTSPLPCLVGLSILGTFLEDPPTSALDLESAGIAEGDLVTVSIRLRASSQVTVPCGTAEAAATLVIDEVSFCGPGVSGDVNGDGAVNVEDLVAVVLAWGACAAATCPADLNGDGAVGVEDLVIVVTGWT